MKDLDKAVMKVLDEYRDTTVDTLEKAVDKAAKQAVSELKQTSPKRTGAYAKDWAAKKERSSNKWAYGKIVYNKKHYRLTHLLEKGHRKVNGGFVRAYPHIEKVEQEAIEELVREIKK